MFLAFWEVPFPPSFPLESWTVDLGALFLLKDVGAPCIGSVYRPHRRPEQPVCGVEAALNVERSPVAVLCDSVENHCSKGPAGQTLLGRRPVPPPWADLGSPFVIRGPSPCPSRPLSTHCWPWSALAAPPGMVGRGASLLLLPCRVHARVGLADPFRSLCCVTPVALV